MSAQPTSGQEPETAVVIDLAYLKTRMDVPDQDELRQILAVARCGTFAEAARETGRDPDTVSRSWHRFRPYLAEALEKLVR